MKRHGVWLAALSMIAAEAAYATPVEQFATRDTYITENPALGGPSSTHYYQSPLWAGGTPGLRSYPLVSFDVRGYRGATVTGTPQFQVWLEGGDPAGDGAARDIGISIIPGPWSEYSANWNNSSGLAAGPLIATQTGIEWPGTGGRYITWDLSTALVQSWIDNPGPTNPDYNPGFAVRNLTESAGRDLSFASEDGGPAPRLTFEVAARTGDFNNDARLDANDVDLLLAQPQGSVPPGNPVFDVNGDGSIITDVYAPNSDVDYWVQTLANTLYGDTDFDGRVVFDDLLRVAKNYERAGGWYVGNFDGRNGVDFADLLLLAQHYNQSAVTLDALPADFAAEWARARALVPEPTTALSVATGLMFVGRRARRVVG